MKKRILYQTLWLIIAGLLVQCNSCKIKPHSQKVSKPNSNPPKPLQPTPITEDMIQVASASPPWNQQFLANVLRALKDHPDTADINARDPSLGEAMTALHYAAVLGNEDIVQALLTRGARVDILDQNDKGLPLHYAAMKPGNAKILALLLDKGDPSHLKMKYSRSSTPLELATNRAKDPAMIKLLQEREATK